MLPINSDFYARPTLAVARDLLGQRLVRELDGRRLSGLIVETEAYIGPDDSASHAYLNRKSSRTQVMFGPPGYSYVYFIYGMHFMLNIVTEAEGFPAAVLIRAIEPTEGLDLMQTHRLSPSRPLASSPPLPVPPSPCPPVSPSPPLPASSLHRLTNGPAKLCQALRIGQKLNNWNVSLGQTLWLEATPPVPAEAIATGPRVGVDYAQPNDRAAPWRFWIKDNKFVSK